MATSTITFQSPFKQLLIKHNRFPHFLCAFPPSYNKKADMFIESSLRGRQLILGLVLLMMTTDLTYLWLVAAPNVTRETVGVRPFIDFYLHSTSRTYGCFLGWQFFFNTRKCIHLVNLVFRLEKYFESKSEKNGPYSLASPQKPPVTTTKTKDTIIRFVDIGYCILHLQPLGPTLLFIKDPFSVRYWPIRFQTYYTNLPTLKYLIVLIGGVLDLLCSIFALFPAAFLVAMFTVYFAKIKFWLRLIRGEKGSLSEKSLKYYRIIEILNKIGHDCFSVGILPSMFTLGYWFVWALLTSIVKQGSSMPFEIMMHFVGALAIMILCINVVIKAAGEIVSESVETKLALS